MARDIFAELGAICSRWRGAPPGTVVPCKSSIVGREIEVKVRGKGGKQRVTVTGCAVPRSPRPSKRCKPDYRVQEVTPALFPFSATVDGGTVRNATRTPRETHPGGAWEFLNGRFMYGPREALEVNQAEGLGLMSGLDLPYPHRAGSHVCCPANAANADELRREVMDADSEGEPLSPNVRARLARLATHLRKHHGAEGLPSKYGPEDYAAATELVTAGDEWCAGLLRRWQDDQVERNALYREESKRKRKAAKSRHASAAKSRKTEVSRGARKFGKYQAGQLAKAERALAALSRKAA